MRTFILANLLLIAAGGSGAWAASFAEDVDPAKVQAIKDFQAADREFDKLYSPCRDCKGKGKIGPKEDERRCDRCLGCGKALMDNHQAFLDQYLAYCDLLTTHATVLEQDQKLRERVEAKRDQYLHSIKDRLGTEPERGRLDRGATAEYSARERAARRTFTQLAEEILRAARADALNHGLMFEGRVVRFLSEGERVLAEVRPKGPTGWFTRTCFVVLPGDHKWLEAGTVRVLGRIVPGDDERKAFALDESATIVKPYFGTQ